MRWYRALSDGLRAGLEQSRTQAVQQAPVARYYALGRLATALHSYGATQPGRSADYPSLVKSAIVEVVVSSSDAKTTYSAHEAVIVKSPEFAKQVEAFAPGGVRPPSRQQHTHTH